MVDTWSVRIGTAFVSAVALALACSSNTTSSNHTGDGQKTDGSVDVGRDSGAGSAMGTGGATGMGGATGTGGATGMGGATGTGGTAETGGTTGHAGAAGSNTGELDSGSNSVNTEDGGNGATSTGSGPPLHPIANTPPTVSKSYKLDLLLMVDNSLSMADKQDVLSRSIPDLFQRIADPASGVTDLHVGVVTSSLGSQGSSTCDGPNTQALVQEEENDHGHLVATRPRFKASSGALAPNANGVLEWSMGKDVTSLTKGVQDMVLAAGEFGCGLEAQLEAVQRFLIDPRPYASITVDKCPGGLQDCASLTGVDDVLLAQRAAFLRPDSVVGIVVLTDENDCSIQEGGQYYAVTRPDVILPHGSTVCTTNPNDPCCYWCYSQPPAGCAADPMCSGAAAQDTALQDPVNLRCFHQKQRFGSDFLYPVQRYVTGLTSTHLCTSRADLVPDTAACSDVNGDGMPDIVDNPLFVNGKTVRDPSMVYFLSLAGVPYQDVATSGTGTLTYQTPAQLTKNGVWGKVLGNDDPGNHEPPIVPKDSLMIESVDPRSGFDGETPPVALAPPSAAPMANPVNGHEWTNSNQDDLQYSCIFPLPAPRDCAQVLMQTPQPGCDCKPGSESDQSPLCQSSSGSYSSEQLYAKSYPGLRELAVAQALGGNGLVASICAKNLTDDTKADFGYRPAVDLLLSQIKSSTK
jgi:hypothetical protein